MGPHTSMLFVTPCTAATSLLPSADEATRIQKLVSGALVLVQGVGTASV